MSAFTDAMTAALAEVHAAQTPMERVNAEDRMAFLIRAQYRCKRGEVPDVKQSAAGDDSVDLEREPDDEIDPFLVSEMGIYRIY